MQIPFFTLERQHADIQEELDNAYKRVMNCSQFILGNEVEKFEESFANYLGIGHCVTCGNGTDALELILKGLGIEDGDEVIIPGNTWMSVAEAVINLRGVPKFADVNPDNYCIDLESLDELINEKTFAVIVVHQFGFPLPVEKLKQTLNKRNIYLIEDCAHATGATITSEKCGTFGNAAAFSFYPTKNLGSLGDGGAVVTNDSELAKKIGLIRNHGQMKRDLHSLSGRNSRLDELQAAFLNVKLNYLEEFNRKRQSIANKYCRELYQPFDSNHVYHQFVIKHPGRDELKDYLKSFGIGTAVHYPKALSDISFLSESSTTPMATSLSSQILSLPIFPELTDDEIDYILKAIMTFDQEYSK